MPLALSNSVGAVMCACLCVKELALDASSPQDFPFIAHVGKLLYWTVPVLSCQRNGDFYASAEAIEAVKLTLTYAHEAQMQAIAEKTGHELEL